MLHQYVYIPRFWALRSFVTKRCKMCACNNPVPQPHCQLGIRCYGTPSFEDVKIDFTEVKPTTGNGKFLLVMVYTYSGCMEAIPTNTETSREVIKSFLELIISWYGLPMSVWSDNRLMFMYKVVLKLTFASKIKWKHHKAYQPQSSGQEERHNGTLKTTLAKLCRETGATWVMMSPIVLPQSWCISYRDGSTPFVIMFRWPPPLVTLMEGPRETAFITICNQMKAFHQVFKEIQQTVLGHPLSLYTLALLQAWGPSLGQKLEGHTSPAQVWWAM